MLRTIPANPTAQQLGEFAKIDKKLESFLADPKIKAEKKAVACLQSIRQDIKTYLGYTRTTRKSTVTRMERVLTVAQKYCASVEQGPLTPELVRSFRELMAFKRSDKIELQGMDFAAVPENIMRLWDGHDQDMQRVVGQMYGVMDHSLLKDPKWDIKAEIKKCLKEYKDHGGEMDRAMKAAKALG